MAQMNIQRGNPTIRNAQDMALSLQIELAGLRTAGVDPAAIDMLEQRITQVAHIVDEFNAKATAARVSGEYSNVGFLRRVDQLATNARAEVAKLAAEVTYQDRIDAIEKKIAATPLRPPKLERRTLDNGEKIWVGPANLEAQRPDVRDGLREQEIRARLADKDRLLVEAELRSAISVGNSLVFAALVDDPLAGTAFALISPKTREETLQAWARKHSPELVGELEGLQRLNVVWTSTLKMAEDCFEARGGSVAHDPVKKAASMLVKSAPDVAA